MESQNHHKRDTHGPHSELHTRCQGNFLFGETWDPRAILLRDEPNIAQLCVEWTWEEGRGAGIEWLGKQTAGVDPGLKSPTLQTGLFLYQGKHLDPWGVRGDQDLDPTLTSKSV